MPPNDRSVILMASIHSDQHLVRGEVDILGIFTKLDIESANRDLRRPALRHLEALCDCPERLPPDTLRMPRVSEMQYKYIRHGASRVQGN